MIGMPNVSMFSATLRIVGVIACAHACMLNCCNSAAAQTCAQWIPVNTLPRSGHAMAYDSVRGVTVMIGRKAPSEDFPMTWEWNGTSWTARSIPNPSFHETLAMVFDESRGVCVLYNGVETWEFDGKAWSLRAAVGPGPGRRDGAAMAYDSLRGISILFGGRAQTGQTTYPADTWAWDGIAWTQVARSGPPGRADHAMACDSARNRIVMFGKSSSSPYASDTWEWDGTSWALVSTVFPKARYNHAMAYHAGKKRVILTAGRYDGYDSATWEWDGQSWTYQTSSGLTPRAWHAMAFDSKRNTMVLFGGFDGLTPLGDTLELNSANADSAEWLVRDSFLVPIGRGGAGVVFDGLRGVSIMFGGYLGASIFSGETWQWNGSKWLLVANSGPAPRADHAICYDSSRGVTVLFGGHGTQGTFKDTWEWNGNIWSLRATTGPAALSGGRMVYDSTRGVSVLFGGLLAGSGQPSSQTWEWNGVGWTLRATVGPGKSRFAMAYDPTRERIVLHGGQSFAIYGDTWEFNGTSWLLRSFDGPSPRLDHTAVFDPNRGKVILHGGYANGGVEFGDLLEWDGVSGRWVSIPQQFEVARFGHGLAYDTVRNRMMFFSGGYSLEFGGSPPDTWELDLTGVPAVPGDVTGDGHVNINDLLAVINAWGPCPQLPQSCPADIAPCGGDHTVNFQDLLFVINNWG